MMSDSTVSERNSALEELKIYGRDPTNADPIFTEEVCNVLLPQNPFVHMLTM